MKSTGIKIKTAVPVQVIRSTMMAQARAGLTKIGMTAEKYAKKKCPVATGNLKNSLTHTVKDLTVFIGTNVKYAPYVELGTGQANVPGGTSKPSWVYRDEHGEFHRAFPQPARPYLKPAIADHLDEYERIMKDALKNNL